MKISSSHRSTRGAAFITTLIFTTLLLAMSAAILSWSTGESRLNRAHSNRMEARNAAEALVEYGAAHATKQVQASTEYNGSFCDPSVVGNNLTPSAAQLTELFAGTNVDPAQVEIVGKIIQVNTSGGYLIDPANARNNYTSFPRGVRGKDGRITLLARASTLPDTTGRRQSIYLEKTYTVLDAPVLQYAAFYNMDLEVAPGPIFNIYGPVHTNGNLWVSKQSNNGATISFWEAVTAVGYVRKGFKVQPIQAAGTRETSSNDPIRFINPSGSFINLYGSYGSYNNVWRDQYMGGTTDRSTDFLAFSNATYGNTYTQSNLQTSAHGVARRALPGQLDNYIADPNPIDGIIAPTYRNVPHALIERPLYNGEVEWIGDEVEKQKMSRKAGLYVVVNADYTNPLTPKPARAPDGTSIPGGLMPGEYRAYARNPTSTTLVPTYTEVKLPGQPVIASNALNAAHPWVLANGTAANQYKDADVRPLVLVRRSQMTDMRRFQELGTTYPTGFNHWLARSAANIYRPKIINLIELDMTVLRMAVDFTVNGQTSTMIFPYDANWGPNGTVTPANGQFTISDNTDPRYRSTYRANISHYGVTTSVNTAVGNISRVGNPGPSTAPMIFDTRYSISGMLATHWDGSVYIESVDADFLNTAYNAGDASAPIPTDTAGGQETWRRRIPGHRISGVRLINGRGPIASANSTRLANTAAPCSPGLTLTTNDALYILGHLNADGRVQTTTVAPTAAQLNSLTVTDAASDGNNSSLFRDPQLIANAPTEQPLALVGDAITILSHPIFDANGYQTGGWCDALSHKTVDASNYNSNWDRTALSSSNQRDGSYIAPTGGNKYVFEDDAASGNRWGRTLSPLQRYWTSAAPADPNPLESTGSPMGLVATADSRPAVNHKFGGATTEISAGFIIGLSPSENNPADTTFSTATNDGNNSGGLHNLPRFLELWGADCAIRGSMVVMFESKVAWEPFSLRVYGPPGRQWGFHNFFRNFYFSDDIPATRNVGTTNADNYRSISRADYITRRNAMWSSYSFPTPP